MEERQCVIFCRRGLNVKTLQSFIYLITNKLIIAN